MASTFGTSEAVLTYLLVQEEEWLRTLLTQHSELAQKILSRNISEEDWVIHLEPLTKVSLRTKFGVIIREKERVVAPDLLLEAADHDLLIPVEVEVSCTTQTVVQTNLYSAMAMYHGWILKDRSLDGLVGRQGIVVSLLCPSKVRRVSNRSLLVTYVLLEQGGTKAPEGSALRLLQEWWNNPTYETLKWALGQPLTPIGKYGGPITRVATRNARRTGQTAPRKKRMRSAGIKKKTGYVER